MKLHFGFYLLLSLSLTACLNAPNVSEVPSIDFLSISKDTLQQSPVGLTDSLIVSFQFEDGDGDLGQDQILDLFVTDNRTGESYGNLSIPSLPEQGASNGINGEISFKIFSTCCIFPDGIPPCESPAAYPENELSLDIMIRDRSGNESNTITTSRVVLLCN